MNKEEKMKLIDFPPESQKELYIPMIHWHRYKNEMSVFKDFIDGKLEPEDINKIRALVADFVGAIHLDSAIEAKIKQMKKTEAQ